jgi:hypothetical protein
MDYERDELRPNRRFKHMLGAVITRSPLWLAMAWEAQSLSLAVSARKALVVARVALSPPWLMKALEALALIWLVMAREALSLSRLVAREAITAHASGSGTSRLPVCATQPSRQSSSRRPAWSTSQTCQPSMDDECAGQW